jgi:hypothetical protein
MSSIQYIGHGRLESSPENFSILHVVAHELSHVQEFKNEAFRENADIAEIRVKIDYEMKENGKLVAVSGETSAVTKKRPDENNDPSLEPYTHSPKNKEDASSKEIDPDKTVDSKKNIQELNLLTRQDNLNTRLKEIENKITSLDTSPHIINSSLDEKNIDVRKQELLREKRKIEEDIRLLKIEETTKKNFQFLASSQKDLLKNAFLPIDKDNDLLLGGLLNTQA